MGAGPVGCIVAAFLNKGGYDVTLCGNSPELIRPSVKDGIIIEGSQEFKSILPKTCGSIEEGVQNNPDVIIICVKAHHLSNVVSAINGLYKKEIHIVVWQNGIDSEIEAARILGKKQVIRAVVNFGCFLKEPCHVIMSFHHPPHYLQELDIESRSFATGIAKAFTKSGLPTEHTNDIRPMIWRKAVLNASMNPVCAVTGMIMSQAMNDPNIFNIVDNLVKECIKVIKGNKIEIGDDFYHEAIEYMRNAGNHKPSMLLDIEKNRKTEIDYLNGKFIEYGKRAGIETPFNTTLRALVKGIETQRLGISD